MHAVTGVLVLLAVGIDGFILGSVFSSCCSCWVSLWEVKTPGEYLERQTRDMLESEQQWHFSACLRTFPGNPHWLECSLMQRFTEYHFFIFLKLGACFRISWVTFLIDKGGQMSWQTLPPDKLLFGVRRINLASAQPQGHKRYEFVQSIITQKSPNIYKSHLDATFSWVYAEVSIGSTKKGHFIRIS